MKKNFNAIWYIMLISYLCSVFPISAYTNTKIPVRTVVAATSPGNTILVRTGAPKNLSFDLTSIPPRASITACELQIKLSKNVSSKMTLDVQGEEGRIDNMFLDNSFKAGSILNFEFDEEDFAGMSLSYRVTLKAPSEKTDQVEFEGAKYPGNNSPRLIITYTLPPTPPIPWAMSGADAQHSGHTFMKLQGAPVTKQFTGKKIADFVDIQTDMVMYKNSIYLYENPKLIEVNPFTGSKSTLVERLYNPVTMPAIDPLGRLYHCSANRVEVIDLESKKLITKKHIAVSNLITTAPTIGPDGTLYLVMEDGIYAYTPYPQHQLLWKYSLGGTKSPVALNQDGTTAYLIAYQSNEIIAINTVNAQRLHASKSRLPNNISEPPKTEGPTIPVLSKDGHIFVTNKLIGASKMYVYDKDLNLVSNISGNRISKAVSGFENKIYYIKDGKLVDYFANVETAFLSPGISARSLVADRSNNVYCLGMNNNLYYYDGSTRRVVSTNNNLACQFALVIGPDGSLYTGTSSQLWSFRGGFGAVYRIKDVDELHDVIALRGMRLVVPTNHVLKQRKILVGASDVRFSENSSIDGAAEIIIEAGQRISFQKGFRVKQGAKLNCKMAY